MLDFFRNSYFISVVFFTLISSQAFTHERIDNQRELIFASDFIRHGARTPIVYIKANNVCYPIAWENIKPGELTTQGLSQEETLGRLLRKTYVNDTHLLPEQYSQAKLLVRSSGLNRTVLSATAILLGLYPLDSSNEHEFKIQVVPTKQDNLLKLRKQDVEKYHTLFTQYVTQTLPWKKKYAKIKKSLNDWHKKADYPINTKSLLDLADTLNSISSYCNKNSNCITQLTGLKTKEITSLAEWYNWSYQYKFSIPKIGEFFGYNPINKVIKDMNEAAKGRAPFSYILYSAHDSTLAGILTYLGMPLDHQPPFASDLRIELYKIKSRAFEVNVTYFEQGKDAKPIYKGSLEDFSKRYSNNSVL